MREAAFIKQNKDKWQNFESVLNNTNQIAPDELSSLYIEITDHLSYAKTFYPEGNTFQYLNQLAATAHQKIYKTQKENKNQIVHFWAKTFPAEFSNYHPELLLAFCIAILFTSIGMYSTATEPGFTRMILGDLYMNLTLENIEKGDPMAIYKKINKSDIFLGITINNIKVALYCFIGGVIFGLLTIYIVIKNFVTLGVFLFFFYEKELFWTSSRTLWIHGTFEIAAIIVAATAGLVVGKSIWFPQTYTRAAAFMRGVLAGLKILLSTLPFFIIAGFLEAFVTRYTEMPDALAILIIVTSLTSVTFYYVFYPLYLKRKVNGNRSQ